MSSTGPITEYALHQVVSSRQLLYSARINRSTTGHLPVASRSNAPSQQE